MSVIRNVNINNEIMSRDIMSQITYCLLLTLPLVMMSTLPSPADKLFSDVDFTMKLEQFLTQSVLGKPFLDALVIKLMPQILENIKNPPPQGL